MNIKYNENGRFYLSESGGTDNNLLNYDDWIAGTSGVTTNYSVTNPGFNIDYRAIGIDMFGNETVIWKGTSTGENPFDTVSCLSNPFNNTKDMDYRFSCWIKRENNEDTVNVSFYSRLFNSGSSYYSMVDVSTGSGGIYGDAIAFDKTKIPENEWMLLSFTLRQYGYTGNTDSKETGLWNLDGINTGIYGYGDLKPSLDAYNNYSRLSLFIVTVIVDSGTISYLYPRIDMLDGTEPSIIGLIKEKKYLLY